MATHTGSEGTIKVSSTTVGELRSYSLLISHIRTSGTYETTTGTRVGRQLSTFPFALYDKCAILMSTR